MQNEARKMNHAEVVNEDERKKRPTNFDHKRKRLEWEQQEAEQKKVRKMCYILLLFTAIISFASYL